MHIFILSFPCPQMIKCRCMLEEIMDRRSIEKALIQVESNKGSGGTDAMRWNELRPYVNGHYQVIRNNVLSGLYRPGEVRSMKIPKPHGGTRNLGIPTVKDRMLQQAISNWLSPRYEEGFSTYSYGFRSGRSAHQAVLQAQKHLKEGRVWIIELDLENFFDKVNHDRLMSQLSRQVNDRRTLKLIRSYLTSGILEGGISSPRTEGTPQGSPLSPLLSNIVLDELDKELERRGHAFVRYADDISIYTRSERAAKRVMASVINFIEKRLLLKVNAEKSRISTPDNSFLLGFSFRHYKGEWVIRVARKSIERVKLKFKAITLRSNSISEQERINRLNALISGWVNYFSIAAAKSLMTNLDGKVRTRLRICKWKEWKKIKTRQANLRKLGAPPADAYAQGASRLGSCRIAHSRILSSWLPSRYFQQMGYKGFYYLYNLKTEKQMKLF